MVGYKYTSNYIKYFLIASLRNCKKKKEKKRKQAQTNSSFTEKTWNILVTGCTPFTKQDAFNYKRWNRCPSFSSETVPPPFLTVDAVFVLLGARDIS